MKVKLNASTLEVIDGIETIEVECVFGFITVRRYFKQNKWITCAPFWWEGLFNSRQFTSSEEAIKFVEMRCEEYINEVLEWVVPHTSVQE